MMEDIVTFGSDCIVAGDGASYNKGKLSTKKITEITGEAMAIVPPMSPMLSCIESVNRIIKS